MKTKEFNRSTGEFTIEVGQADVLLAPPEYGFERKYLPCSHCQKLMVVSLDVVAACCSDQCHSDLEEAELYRGQSEISGYAHAAGYPN